jgi:peroxisomal enoyl-CoA hydratase 2
LTDKTAILYSLGIGFSKDPMNRDHFKFTYEFDGDFRPFPTNAVTIAQVSEKSFKVPGLPDFNPMMLLHGEEDVQFIKPLTKDTTYIV